MPSTQSGTRCSARSLHSLTVESAAPSRQLAAGCGRTVRRLGSLLNTALQLRRQVAGVTVLAVVPVLIWLLAQNGASRLTIFVLVSAVLAGSGLELITRIYAVALAAQIGDPSDPKPGTSLGASEAGDCRRSIVNFHQCCGGYFVGGHWICGPVWMLRRWVHREVDRSAPTDPVMRSEIVAVLKETSATFDLLLPAGADHGLADQYIRQRGERCERWSIGAIGSCFCIAYLRSQLRWYFRRLPGFSPFISFADATARLSPVT